VRLLYPGGNALYNAVLAYRITASDALVGHAELSSLWYFVVSGESSLSLRWNNGVFSNSADLGVQGVGTDFSAIAGDLQHLSVAPTIPTGLHLVQLQARVNGNVAAQDYYPLRVHVLPNIGIQWLTNGQGIRVVSFTDAAALPAPSASPSSCDEGKPFYAKISSAGATAFDVFPRGEGMVINHSQGDVYWPEPQAGDHTFSIWAHNGSQSVSVSWQVHVNERPLAITSPSSATVSAGGAWQFLSNKTGVNWSVTPQPAGFVLNGDQLNIAGTVTAGTYSFNVSANRNAENASQTFALTVTNNNGTAPLVFTGSTAPTVPAGGTITLTSSKPGTMFTTGTLPPGMSFNPANNTLTIGPATPPGQHIIDITGANGQESIQQTLTVNVTTPAPVNPTNPSSTTVTYINPDGSTTTATNVTNPNGTQSTVITTVPAGGGTPVVTQTTTGTPGTANADVVNAIEGLPQKLGVGSQPYAGQSGDSLANLGNATSGEAVRNMGGFGSFNVPAITPEPLIATIKIPTRPGMTMAETAPALIEVSTAPPAPVVPYLPVIRLLIGFSASWAFYRYCVYLWKNL